MPGRASRDIGYKGKTFGSKMERAKALISYSVVENFRPDAVF